MLLALDTATTTASLAVYDIRANQLLAEQTWEARRRQTQDLLTTAQQLLAQLGLAPQALTALAVTTGPGSFTGVRIGISTVKGIGLGLPLPPRVIGLPTLAVTAAPWLDLLQKTAPESLICALIQAGRGRYNWVFFAGNAVHWRPAVADHHSGTVTEIIAALRTRNASTIWLAGECDEPLRDAVATLPQVVLLDPISSWRRAGQLARLAALQLATGSVDDLASLQPLYLRAPSS
ncbi:MAG: tRNA (adenosine(37)-N6)-threonylcarbamoyltransferase complex dimerization subunit type 1 TsaB [Caldilineaceae bacterium]